MKQALIDQAIASLDAIIRDEIDGDDPQKYTRIIAIAVQAHRMRKGTRRRDRVADHLGDGGAIHGAYRNIVGHHLGGVHDVELNAAMQGELVEDMEPAERVPYSLASSIRADSSDSSAVAASATSTRSTTSSSRPSCGRCDEELFFKRHGDVV